MEFKVLFLTMFFYALMLAVVATEMKSFGIIPNWFFVILIPAACFFASKYVAEGIIKEVENDD